jgi:hypothetical protein
MYNFQNMKFHKSKFMRKDGAEYNARNRATSAILLFKAAKKLKMWQSLNLNKIGKQFGS